MKQSKLTFMLFVLMSMICNKASAYDFSSSYEGKTIYYNIVDGNAQVTYRDNNYNSYSGNISIPEKVKYSGKTYSVTNIGGSAFDGCSGLTSIEISNSVTSIGNYAFYGCSALTSIEIPNSVTSIGRAAFFGCSSLTSIEIPNSVTSIGSFAFSDCSGLTSVTIPNSVTSIGNNAFKNCWHLTSVTIPNSVTIIEPDTFYGCSRLTSVSIPNSVTSILDHAFYNCTGLTSVTIPNSVTSIGYYAFWGCSRLSSLTIPNSVTSIGNSAFYDCSRLSSVTIPGSVTSIGNSAFYGCNQLVDVTVEIEEPISISESTFSNRANAKLSVPNGCKAAYEAADYWKEFKEIVEKPVIIDFADANVKALCVANWDADGDGELSEAEAAAVTSINKVFRKSEIQTFNELKYFTGLTSIYSEAFEKCRYLTSVRIPQNVKSINSQAFKECSSLTEINIPGSVVDIAYNSFDGCRSFTKVVVEDIAAWCNLNCQIYLLNNAYLYSDENTVIKDLVIPNGVTTIRKEAFYGCKSISSITIPNGVTTIGSSAFQECSNLTLVTLPNSIVAIENSTFRDCSSLPSFIIPDGVKTIRSRAFSNCSSLTSITIPASVNCIEGTPFNGCTKLSSIIVDSNNETYKSPTGSLAIIKKANQSLVAGCENTIMPSDVVSIGSSAFSGCSFSSIIIPDNVISIGSNSFENCRGLTTIKIPDNVISIDDYAFSGCGNLQSIIIPSSVTSIGNSAFQTCNRLKSATINGATSIGNRAFYGCNKLKSLVLSNGITSIGASAFEGCTDLTSIKLPGSVTTIGASAFLGCTGLTSATINGSASIEWQAFNNCHNLQSVNLSDGVKTIGNNVFVGCTSLTSIILPQTVTSIGSAAFSGCNNLLLVVSENDNPTQINDGAFYGINTNARLQVPKGTKSKYEAVTGWKNYFKEIVDDGITPEVFTLAIKVDGLGNVTYDGTAIRNSSYTSFILGGRSAKLSFSADNVNGLESVKINNNDVTSSIINNQYSTEAITSNTFIEVKYEYPTLADGTFEVDYSFATFKFKVISESDKTCELSAAWCDEDDVDVIVPSSIYGYKVIGIGNYAFDDEDDMESITLPPTITYIGRGAFDEGGTVNDVYISDLEAWCKISFANSYSAPSYGNIWLNGNKITDLVIPNSINRINNYAFYGLSCIQSVYIPEGVESIGANVFPNSLSSVTVCATEPFSIEESSFTNRSNALLYVPFGCKAAYEAADYWKDFKEIVELEREVTDISALDNALYIEPFSARIGDEVNIEVRLKNAEAATSYGFDLVLPVGMSIATEADNSFDDAVTLSSRNSKHTTTTNKLSADRYKIGVASLSSKALTGNDGLVLTIKAQVADDMAVGDYAVTIENPLLVLTDGTKPAVEATATKVTIEDYVKGDVDGDGVVDLADAVLVINYYVGKTVNNFAAKAADVDGDGVIDLADAVKIINYYVGKIPSLSRGQRDEEHDPE